MPNPEFGKFLDCITTYLADDDEALVGQYRRSIGVALNEVGDRAPSRTKGRTIAQFVAAAERYAQIAWDPNKAKSIEQYAEFGRTLKKGKGDKTLAKAIHFLLLSTVDKQDECVVIDRVLHGKDENGEIRSFQKVHEWAPKRALRKNDIVKLSAQKVVRNDGGNFIVPTSSDPSLYIEPNTRQKRCEVQNANPLFVQVSDAALTQVPDPLREFQVFLKLRAMELGGRVDQYELLLGLFELYCYVHVRGSTITKRFNTTSGDLPDWVEDLPDDSWWFFGPRHGQLGWLKGVLVEHSLFRGSKEPPKSAKATIRVVAKRRDFDVRLSDGSVVQRAEKVSLTDAMISAFVMKLGLKNSEEYELCRVDMEL